MNEPTTNGPTDADLAHEIAVLLREQGRTVAAAESLTSGLIVQRLGAAEEASTWLRGGLVAYASEVKVKLLGVEPGPVITAACARQMAAGAAALFDADLSVAVTGAGGPGSEEGHPAGTVFISVSDRGHVECVQHRFEGESGEVVAATTHEALRMLRDRLTEGPAVHDAPRSADDRHQ